MLRAEPARVPCLWWFEPRNTLIVNERRGRLAAADTAAFLGHVARLPVALDPVPGDGAVLALARTHRLTPYDAADLELAQRAALPLATLDAALARAAQAEGMALLGR
jgi:predicted nucleic acid-binding protein